MADHHHHHQQQQPTTDDDWLAQALAEAAYPRKHIQEKMDVYDEIMSGLAAAPAVRTEFVRLLSEYGEHDGGGGDPCALRSRAADLLRRGHPDVLRSFFGEIDAVPVPTALTTTLTKRRRSDRRRRGSGGEIRRAGDTETQQQMQIPAAVAAAKHGDNNDDEEVRLGEALAFFNRVHETAGPVVHGRILALMFEVERRGSDGGGMDVEEVYDRAKEVFGRAHVALLHAFATLWLPGAAEWKLQQQQQQQAAALASSPRAAVLHPSKKKKAPAGAVDDGNHDHVVVAVLEVRRKVKKRRGDFDGAAGRGRHGGALPRAVGESEISSGGDNEKPLAPRRRRAAKGSTSAGPEQQTEQERERERDEEFRRFRREWEFQTCYSKLVATIDRVTELLLRCTPHGIVGGVAGHRSSSSSSMEELFPLRECREFLASCYGDRWGEMRAALLERGDGESRVRALEAIGRSLRRKEEEAVVEECRKRRRLDPGRVAQRLHGIAVDTVDEERRRRCVNGGTLGMAG